MKYQGPGVTSIDGKFAWIGRKGVTAEQASEAPIMTEQSCPAPKLPADKLSNQKGCCKCTAIKCAVQNKLEAIRDGERGHVRPNMRRSNDRGPRKTYLTLGQREEMKKGQITSGLA